MPSFDIVSEINSMEIENAVNQANKELANRFDFKGVKAEIVLDKNEIKLSAEDEFRVKTLVEMVMGKLAKRQISLKNVEKLDSRPFTAWPRATGHQDQAGHRDAHRQGNHQLHPRYQTEGDHADPGQRNPRFREKPG